MRLPVFVLLPAFCVGGLCQTIGAGDTHDCERAAEFLRAASTLEKSWGAHWAAVCRLRGLAGEIATELARADPETLAKSVWDSEPFWMAHSMLDGLIQLRQPLAEPVLESIAKGFPVEATILMLQFPEANRQLLAAIHAHSGGAEWVAASNSLARMRAPGFAATLLAEIPLSQWVVVSDTGDAPERGTAGSLASGGPTVRVPPNFPVVGMYRLTGQRSPGDELVSDGSVPIYSHRIPLEPGVKQILDYPAEGYCTRCLEIGYLAELSGVTRAEAAHVVEWRTAVRWTNLLEFGAEVSRGLTDQETALNHLAGLLISAGALGRAELQRPLHIEVEIDDRRSDRSVPLPRYAPIDFRVW
jgi:hypothetical protein